jgi:hypothetical protein
MSSRTRMLGAGRAGSTAYGSNVNMIQFGDRLQGLAPQATHFFIAGNGRAGWQNYQTRTNAPKRKYVFCMNQLGGVGRGKSQFKVDGVNNPDGSMTCPPYPYDPKEALNKKDEYHKTLSSSSTNQEVLNKKCYHSISPYSDLTRYDDLSTQEKLAVAVLGLEQSWDSNLDYGLKTEEGWLLWKDLDSNIQGALRILGWTENTWNGIPMYGCPPNMLCRPVDFYYSWNDITHDRQELYKILGYTPTTWEISDARKVFTSLYSDLPPAKKNAVDALCYTPESWDAQMTLGWYDEYHKTLSGMEISSYPISSSSSSYTVTFELNSITENYTSDIYLNNFLLPAMCNNTNVTNQCLPDNSCTHPCNPTDCITLMILEVNNENTSTDITLFKYDQNTNELINYLPGVQPTLTLYDISDTTKFNLIIKILPGDSNGNPSPQTITTIIPIKHRQIEQEFYLEGSAIPEEDFGLTSYLALFAGLFNKVILKIDNDTGPDKPHVSYGLDGCPNSLCLEYPLEVKILGTNSNYDSEKQNEIQVDYNLSTESYTKPVELYYRLRDDHGNSVSESLDFIDIAETTEYKGMGALLLTNSKYEFLPNTKIVFEGKRIVTRNPYSGFDATVNQYAEKAFVQVENGDSVEFSTVYGDPGTGFATEISFVDYPIKASTGIFKPFNVARITFDNEGTIFDQKVKFSRKITFY